MARRHDLTTVNRSVRLVVHNDVNTVKAPARRHHRRILSMPLVGPTQVGKYLSSLASALIPFLCERNQSMICITLNSRSYRKYRNYPNRKLKDRVKASSLFPFSLHSPRPNATKSSPPVYNPSHLRRDRTISGGIHRR